MSEPAYLKSSHCTGGGCVEIAFTISSYCANGGCVEVGFHKSSYSDNKACVEVGSCDCDGNLILVRDSKDKTGPTLSFTPDAWTGFLSGIRDGDFS